MRKTTSKIYMHDIMKIDTRISRSWGVRLVKFPPFLNAPHRIGLKSFCFAFNPKLYKLSLPHLHINKVHLSFVDSVKYLGFTFVSTHKYDDDMMRQM